MMIFKERRLLNAEEKEIFCNLQRLCPDHIAVMAKVKLSEFLLPAREYGTELFYHEFLELNKVTAPFLLLNLRSDKVLAVFHKVKGNENVELEKIKEWLLSCQINVFEFDSLSEMVVQVSELSPAFFE